jgi:hypothetical protein
MLFDAGDNGNEYFKFISYSGTTPTTLLDLKRGTSTLYTALNVTGDITAQTFYGTGNSYFLGNVGVGTTNPGEKLQVAGNLRIGSSSYSNYISFFGITGDNPGGFDHTYIGERIYAPNELSELFIFKGNDVPGAGPDRVRIGAAEFRVDTFTSALSGTFEDVANSSLLINRFIIDNYGNIGIGTSAPNSKLYVVGNTTINRGITGVPA